MSVEFLSVTSLMKDALGLSRGIEYYGKEAVGMAAVENPKKLARYEINWEAVEAFKTSGHYDREGLAEWNEALDWLLRQQWEGLKSAASRGTEIHTVAEQLHLGNVVEYDEFLEPWVVQYRRFLEEFQPEFLMAEAPVYNMDPRYPYAGTLDGIAVIDGSKVVVDIKTTAHGPKAVNRKGNPRSRPPFSDVALQLTMYRRATHVGLLAERKEIQYRRYYLLSDEAEAHLEPMPDTEGGVCVVISPEDYLVVPVDTGEQMWKYVRHVVQVAKFQVEYAKTVFGPVIQPRVEA